MKPKPIKKGFLRSSHLPNFDSVQHDNQLIINTQAERNRSR